MTDQQPEPPGEIPPWDPPDTIVALEPDTEPEHPLRAMDVPALLPKDIA